MNAKHKPATALPWYVDGEKEMRQQLAACNGIALKSYRREYDARCAFTNLRDCPVQDAAYIVHAANAYPKLVEALRQWLPANPLEDGTQDAAMRALLRELGESTT